MQFYSLETIFSLLLFRRLLSQVWLFFLFVFRFEILDNTDAPVQHQAEPVDLRQPDEDGGDCAEPGDMVDHSLQNGDA